MTQGIGVVVPPQERKERFVEVRECNDLPASLAKAKQAKRDRLDRGKKHNIGRQGGRRTLVSIWLPNVHRLLGLHGMTLAI